MREDVAGDEDTISWIKKTAIFRQDIYIMEKESREPNESRIKEAVNESELFLMLKRKTHKLCIVPKETTRIIHEQEY